MADTTYYKMNATMINSTLMNKWNGYDFGLGFQELTTSNHCDLTTYNPYFFLTRELAVTNYTEFANAKKQNLIRHCKPYNGRWLDYVVMKEFDTLSDWVTDCGAKLDDVVYGVNRVHKYHWIRNEGQNRYVPYTPKFICLGHLLDAIGYTPPTVVTKPVGFEETLKSRGLSLDNLWVIADRSPVQWKTFVEA